RTNCRTASRTTSSCSTRKPCGAAAVSWSPRRTPRGKPTPRARRWSPRARRASMRREQTGPSDCAIPTTGDDAREHQTSNLLPAMIDRHAAWSMLALALALAPAAAARDAGEPIKLAYDEGDVAGIVSIFAKEGNDPIGIVRYTQRRKGDTIEA